MQASSSGKLPSKAKEKALLRCTLYQIYYMHSAPRYAIGQEMGNLAKKYCHSTFASFLNALIRKLPEELPEFPSLGLKYSYPDALIGKLRKEYSLKEVEGILVQGNLPAKTSARIRPGFEMQKVAPEEVAEVASSPEYYIMNATPAKLIEELSSFIKVPESILDLCASPGGKLIALHDKFPKAMLFANDVSESKLTRLKENCEKYSMSVTFSQGEAQDYPEDTFYDLVVLDVPCSNTGVFSKHPEARWREENLVPLQQALLEKAKKLVKPGGHIFYLTCSVLKEETPDCEKLFERQILPLEEGQDGGYGCVIKI